MKLLLFCVAILLIFSSSSIAQERIITGRVTDAKTKLPLGSCSVYAIHSGNGVITNEDGMYSLNIPGKIDSIAISMVGYTAVIKAVSKQDNQVINFEVQTAQGSMEEVAVSARSKYSKAQRLVRLVIKHKGKNDIYENNNFRTKVYDKIELDIKNISQKIQSSKLLKPLRFVLNNMDSTTDNQKYLPVYLSETIADFYYKKKPEKERYDFTAIKSSGLDNQSILTYIDGLYKKINVYNNLIKLVDINFVSPIADNALGLYNYHINDTMSIDGHQCIQVQFSQIQYGTNTFNGFMWIVDTTYALKSMTMHMDKSASINFVNKFEITQNFELQGSKFLPSKNILYIDLNIPAMKKMGVIAKKTTLFQNFNLNDPSIDTAFAKKAKDIASITIKTDTAYWRQNRFENLTKTENSVYRLMDTLNKIPAIVTYGKIIDVLSSGWYNAGNIDLGNIYGIYYSDRIEGSRFTAGFRTHSTLSDKFRLKGYLGYSTKDAKFRYSLGTLFILDKKQWSTLNIVHSDDIAASYDHDDELDQNSIFASLLRRIKSTEIRLVNNKQLDIYYNKFFANGFGVKLETRSSTLTPYFNTYFTHDKFTPYIISKPGDYGDYKTNELAFTVRYVYKEKFIIEHFRRGSLGSNYPIINLTYTKGFKVNSPFLKSDFDYNKWKINITHDFSAGRIGQLSYILEAGITKGILPIVFLDVQKGNDTYYYNSYAFNNMNRYEFVADKYASVSLQNNFGSFPFNYLPGIKKFKWRSLFTFKSVLGNMSEQNRNANAYYNPTINYHFKIPNNAPYMEAGVGIENIFRLLRLDAIWRLNYLGDPKVPKFGILGSIQFKF